MNARPAEAPPLYGPARAWAMWSAGALYFCYGFFHRVAPSVMTDDLMRDFHVGAGLLGNLAALYLYAYVAVQIPVGLAVDRFGPRRLLTLGAATCALGSLVFALAPGLTLASVGRLLIGLGAATGWISTLKIAANTFPPHRFASLTGLTVALGMAGAVMAQAPLALAIEAVGWRDTLVVAALAGFLLAAALYALVRDGVEPHLQSAQAGPQATGMGVIEGLRRAVTHRPVLLVGLCAASLTAPVLAFAGLWGVPFLVQVHGMERGVAALSTSSMLIGFGIGGPLFGIAADRTGHPRPLLVGGALAAAGVMSAIVYAPALSTAQAQALFFAGGLCLGAMAVAFAAARDVAPPGTVGTTIAFVNMLVTGSGALFQPLLGVLLDLNWDGAMLGGARVYTAEAYRMALAVLPAALLASGLAALALPTAASEADGRGASRQG